MKNKFSYFVHPNRVCMSYFKHFKFSMSMSRQFMNASMKAFIHAIYPNAYITSTSDAVKKITKELRNSGCNK